MIVRRDQVPAAPDREDRAARYGGYESLRYSDAGGLTQFGAYVETLQPGSRSSERHVLSGEATVIENDGAHVLRPGDAASWPAGEANAHRVENRSAAPCTYLIVGTRVAQDVVHYPDAEKVLFIDGGTWRLQRTDGTLIKEGTE